MNQNQQTIQQRGSNKKLIIILVAIFAFLIIVGGILVTMVMNSLNDYSNKLTQDVHVMQDINKVVKELMAYRDQKGTIQGFTINQQIQQDAEKYGSMINFQDLNGYSLIISAPIPSQPGKYYCINNSGETYEVEKEILDTKSCGAKKLNK